MRLKSAGFTFVELLVSVLILVVVTLAVLNVLSSSYNLQEVSRNTGNALVQIRSRIEEIRSTNFDLIVSTYNNQASFLAGLNGQMRTQAAVVANSNNNLINIRVIAGWAQSRNRLIGEGSINNTTGNFTLSDIDTDGIIESSVEVVTSINRI
jgi:type II secretory pathway pseudopilin PulG